MPEAKNTFIQSKMNKDMDGRILPNGQYRDGENVQISRSEGDDVGALETVLGNIKLTDFGLSGNNLKTIGSYFDDTSNNIFLFITNYTDSSPNQLDNECVAADGVNCYILSYNVQTSTSTILVQGDFLNFSQTHPVIGINLLENLLFWTDNRNQPRKIDINLAVANYYRREDQISVAKYYPYTSPLLMQYVGRPAGGGSADWIGWESTMTDTTSEYLPIHTAAKVKRDEAPDEYVLYGRYTNIMPNTDGYIGSPNGCLITGDGVPSGTTVASVSVIGNETTITVSPSFAAADDQILYFQFKNPSYLLNWPGDPEYLKDKFVRFSYRFKFDNNEYSLIAPFTQIAFIPQQDGYFIGDKARQNIEIPNGNSTILANPDMFGQEAETFDSTVVPFMQNKVTNIDVCLIAPSVGNSLSNINWSQINNLLKVTEVDILLKESSTNNIYVVETLGLDKLNNTDSEYLFYNYQSKKPWRTLPTDQVTRVSDVVPLRALAQEVTGNRVVYGNFVEKHASPERLSYHLSVGQKPFIPTFFDTTTKFEEEQYIRKEYQNHTLKQNRTYQVGVVLSDRYGRKSNVILSELIDVDSSKKNSTIFHNYANSNNLVIYDDQQFVDQGADTWPGDLLSIVWTSIIPVESTQDGYPGVYSVNDGTLQRILVNQGTSTVFPANDDCVFDVVNVLAGATASIQAFSDANGLISEVKIRSSNNKWKDGMELVSDFFPAGGGFPCNGWTNQTFRGNAVCPADRPLGWYSYNIVVKQTEQEYYNVYMPNALAGYPCNQNPTGNVNITFGETPSMVYPIGQQNTTSHLTLFGDNINKIPRDLNEVGPEQNSFRSSERLFHRVESILFSDNLDNIQYSSQPYSPSASGDKVVTISNMSKLDLGNLITNPAYPILPNLIYKANTDPFIARISTEERFGIVANSTINACITTESKVGEDPNDILIQVNNTTYASGPTLSISETQPVESLLDIFWETSTSGLIADLNDKIENQDNTAPAGLSPVQISWSEGDPYESSISGQFSAIGSTGLALVGDSEIELVSVTRGDNVSCIDQFDLIQLGFGEVELKISAASSTNPGFLHWKDQLKNQYNFKFIITQLSTGSTAIQEVTGFLSNKPPVERLQTVSGTEINWADVKEAICRPGDLTTKNLRENAQTMSLKAEQGSQKYGLTFEGNIPGTDISRNVKWRQYVESEDSFPNTPVNFGFISPTDDKYYNAAPFWRNEDHPCCVDTNMDGGDIMISGQYDFGWFGGPSIPGQQFFRDGDNKFRTLWYSPGDNDLNSCTYSQKIYAPDPSLYQVGNNTYPVNGNSGDRNEMGKYFRGATSWGSQPDIKWDSPILDETAFEKEVTTNDGNKEEWDGTFAARNGEYGSDIFEGWPNINGSPSGIGTSLEIEWSIPRMYQVSMMIPHGDKPNNNPATSFIRPGTGPLLFDLPFDWLMPSRTAFITGLVSTSGSKYFDVQPAGEVIFGLIPEGTIDGYANNKRNSILKYLPKGPIYWDSSSNSARDGFQGESQLDPENRIGEYIVGAKSNVYSDEVGGGQYPHHYWPDLNALLQYQNPAVPNYSSFRNGNLGDAPDFMKLQDGANTFYQFNKQHATFKSEWQGGKSDTAYQFPYRANAVKNCGSWRQNPENPPTSQLNALGHLFYLGGIQGGYGSSSNGQTFFVAPEPIQPGLTSSKAKIHAGPVNGSATSWSGPNDFGQGLPGGRYVVTLRATDVGGDGAFVEWDVPIYLPWWSTRTNSPLRI